MRQRQLATVAAGKPIAGLKAEIAGTVNTMSNVTEANINGVKTLNGSITTSGDVILKSTDHSDYAGAVVVWPPVRHRRRWHTALNTITNQTRAKIEDANVVSTAGKIDLDVDSNTDIVGIALGVNVATGTVFSGAGSVASNVISNNLEAYIANKRLSGQIVTYRSMSLMIPI